jgi:hypothetical protein
VAPNGINPGEWLLILATAFDPTSTASSPASCRAICASGCTSRPVRRRERDLHQHPTPIPLPAGLLLFLSGLAGVGFLGRYKARRRETAAA